LFIQAIGIDLSITEVYVKFLSMHGPWAFVSFFTKKRLLECSPRFHGIIGLDARNQSTAKSAYNGFTKSIFSKFNKVKVEPSVTVIDHANSHDGNNDLASPDNRRQQQQRALSLRLASFTPAGARQDNSTLP
jgi:hypothetical protein